VHKNGYLGYPVVAAVAARGFYVDDGEQSASDLKI
jgi:hypothetical protein